MRVRTPRVSKANRMAYAGVDCIGQDVPEQLHDVFATAVIHDSIRELASVVAKVNSAVNWNPYLIVKPSLDCLEKAIAMLQASLPYAVCTDCYGSGKGVALDCQVCRGAGWLPKWRIEELE